MRKKQYFKRTIAGIAAAVMLMSAIPVNTFALSSSEVQSLYKVEQMDASTDVSMWLPKNVQCTMRLTEGVEYYVNVNGNSMRLSGSLRRANTVSAMSDSLIKRNYALTGLSVDADTVTVVNVKRKTNAVGYGTLYNKWNTVLGDLYTLNEAMAGADSTVFNALDIDSMIDVVTALETPVVRQDIADAMVAAGASDSEKKAYVAILDMLDKEVDESVATKLFGEGVTYKSMKPLTFLDHYNVRKAFNMELPSAATENPTSYLKGYKETCTYLDVLSKYLKALQAMKPASKSGETGYTHYESKDKFNAAIKDEPIYDVLRDYLAIESNLSSNSEGSKTGNLKAMQMWLNSNFKLSDLRNSAWTEYQPFISTTYDIDKLDLSSSLLDKVYAAIGSTSSSKLKDDYAAFETAMQSYLSNFSASELEALNYVTGFYDLKDFRCLFNTTDATVYSFGKAEQDTIKKNVTTGQLLGGNSFYNVSPSIVIEQWRPEVMEKYSLSSYIENKSIPLSESDKLQLQAQGVDPQGDFMPIGKTITVYVNGVSAATYDTMPADSTMQDLAVDAVFRNGVNSTKGADVVIEVSYKYEVNASKADIKPKEPTGTGVILQVPEYSLAEYYESIYAMPSVAEYQTAHSGTSGAAHTALYSHLTTVTNQVTQTVDGPVSGQGIMSKPVVIEMASAWMPTWDMRLGMLQTGGNAIYKNKTYQTDPKSKYTELSKVFNGKFNDTTRANTTAGLGAATAKFSGSSDSYTADSDSGCDSWVLSTAEALVNSDANLTAGDVSTAATAVVHGSMSDDTPMYQAVQRLCEAIKQYTNTGAADKNDFQGNSKVSNPTTTTLKAHVSNSTVPDLYWDFDSASGMYNGKYISEKGEKENRLELDYHLWVSKSTAKDGIRIADWIDQPSDWALYSNLFSGANGIENTDTSKADSSTKGQSDAPNGCAPGNTTGAPGGSDTVYDGNVREHTDTINLNSLSTEGTFYDFALGKVIEDTGYNYCKHCQILIPREKIQEHRYIYYNVGLYDWDNEKDDGKVYEYDVSEPNEITEKAQWNYKYSYTYGTQSYTPKSSGGGNTGWGGSMWGGGSIWGGGFGSGGGSGSTTYVWNAPSGTSENKTEKGDITADGVDKADTSTPSTTADDGETSFGSAFWSASAGTGTLNIGNCVTTATNPASPVTSTKFPTNRTPKGVNLYHQDSGMGNASQIGTIGFGWSSNKTTISGNLEWQTVTQGNEYKETDWGTGSSLKVYSGISGTIKTENGTLKAPTGSNNIIFAGSASASEYHYFAEGGKRDDMSRGWHTRFGINKKWQDKQASDWNYKGAWVTFTKKDTLCYFVQDAHYFQGIELGKSDNLKKFNKDPYFKSDEFRQLCEGMGYKGGDKVNIYLLFGLYFESEEGNTYVSSLLYNLATNVPVLEKEEEEEEEGEDEAGETWTYYTLTREEVESEDVLFSVQYCDDEDVDDSPVYMFKIDTYGKSGYKDEPKLHETDNPYGSQDNPITSEDMKNQNVSYRWRYDSEDGRPREMDKGEHKAYSRIYKNIEEGIKEIEQALDTGVTTYKRYVCNQCTQKGSYEAGTETNRQHSHTYAENWKSEASVEVSCYFDAVDPNDGGSWDNYKDYSKTHSSSPTQTTIKVTLNGAQPDPNDKDPDMDDLKPSDISYTDKDSALKGLNYDCDEYRAGSVITTEPDDDESYQKAVLEACLAVLSGREPNTWWYMENPDELCGLMRQQSKGAGVPQATWTEVPQVTQGKMLPGTHLGILQHMSSGATNSEDFDALDGGAQTVENKTPAYSYTTYELYSILSKTSDAVLTDNMGTVVEESAVDPYGTLNPDNTKVLTGDIIDSGEGKPDGERNWQSDYITTPTNLKMSVVPEVLMTYKTGWDNNGDGKLKEDPTTRGEIKAVYIAGYNKYALSLPLYGKVEVNYYPTVDTVSSAVATTQNAKTLISTKGGNDPANSSNKITEVVYTGAECTTTFTTTNSSVADKTNTVTFTAYVLDFNSKNSKYTNAAKAWNKGYTGTEANKAVEDWIANFMETDKSSFVANMQTAITFNENKSAHASLSQSRNTNSTMTYNGVKHEPVRDESKFNFGKASDLQTFISSAQEIPVTFRAGRLAAIGDNNFYSEGIIDTATLVNNEKFKSFAKMDTEGYFEAAANMQLAKLATTLSDGRNKRGGTEAFSQYKNALSTSNGAGLYPKSLYQDNCWTSETLRQYMLNKYTAAKASGKTRTIPKVYQTVIAPNGGHAAEFATSASIATGAAQHNVENYVAKVKSYDITRNLTNGAANWYQEDSSVFAIKKYTVTVELPEQIGVSWKVPANYGYKSPANKQNMFTSGAIYAFCEAAIVFSDAPYIPGTESKNGSYSAHIQKNITTEKEIDSGVDANSLIPNTGTFDIMGNEYTGFTTRRPEIQFIISDGTVTDMY